MIILRQKTYAWSSKAYTPKGEDNREDVPEKILEEAKKSGVVQKDGEGHWRIISIKAGKYWTPKYQTKEKAENALAAYLANK